MTAANLEQDLRTYVKEALKRYGVSMPAATSFDDLFLALFTIEERRIVPAPRRIHKSAAFIADVRSLPKPESVAVAKILQKLRIGGDVNPHLNRRSLLPTRDDDLLTDWGLYHFHLSLQGKPGDNFLGRTGNLAFAHVTPTDAYFVRVMPHQKFAEPELVKTLLRGFADVARRYEMRGVTALSHPSPSNAAEVTAYRKVHVNVPIELDGKVYMGPGYGFMASGHSFIAVRRLVVINHAIRDFAKYLRTNDAELRMRLAEKIGGDPARFVFGMTLHENRPMAFEKTSKTIITFS